MTSPLRTFLFTAIAAFASTLSNVAAGEKPSGVYVEVEIEYETGKVTDAHLTKSTGDPKLDQKAVEEFRKKRFQPKKFRRLRFPILAHDDKK